jgi:hypothetical protein
MEKTRMKLLEPLNFTTYVESFSESLHGKYIAEML